MYIICKRIQFTRFSLFIFMQFSFSLEIRMNKRWARESRVKYIKSSFLLAWFSFYSCCSSTCFLFLLNFMWPLIQSMKNRLTTFLFVLLQMMKKHIVRKTIELNHELVFSSLSANQNSYDVYRVWANADMKSLERKRQIFFMRTGMKPQQTLRKNILSKRILDWFLSNARLHFLVQYFASLH